MINDSYSTSVSLTEGKDNSLCMERMLYVTKNLRKASMIKKNIFPVNFLNIPV